MTLLLKLAKQAEADSYYVLVFLMTKIKRNFVNGFVGVYEYLALLKTLVEKCDQELHEYL